MDYLFDTENQDHTDLLHPDVRSADNLEWYAKQVEDDILERFTADHKFASNHGVGVPSQPVMLDEYYESPQDPDFTEDFVETVAEVLSHRLQNMDVDKRVKSKSRGKRSVSYDNSNTNTKWPSGWKKRLRKWDLRDEVWWT